jgi:phospholipid/cholesterol/gamma-HCH transport system substrate-binding protein
VKRAIKLHRRDFLAIAALIVMAAAVTGYILSHQPAFSFNKSYYTVSAAFAAAPAVEPGQGQSVNIAGVPVGEVGGVTLQNGQAVVSMNIERKYAPIYRNASVLLRPRTPLKDMYLSLDPGTASAGPVPDGGSLSAASTLPNIDVEQVLSSLDSDSRDYLILLLAGAAGALRDAGANGETPSSAAVHALRGTLQRFEPLARDTKSFATLLSQRQANLARAIHALSAVSQQVGGVSSDLAGLVTSANVNFEAISSQDAALEQSLTLLPPALAQTTATLGQVQSFAAVLAPTLTALQPFARALAPALRATRPFLRGTTPVIANQLRPFSVALQPLARQLRPAALDLAAAIPSLSKSIAVVNSLLNELAHEPGGNQQSYLFWGAWLAHIVNSLTSVQDAQGPTVRGQFEAECPALGLLAQVELGNPTLAALLDLLDAPDQAKICTGAGS